MNSIFIKLKLDEKTSSFQKFKERWKKRILDKKNKVILLTLDILCLSTKIIIRTNKHQICHPISFFQVPKFKLDTMIIPHKPNQNNVLQLFYLFDFMTYCTLLKYIRYVSPELQVCCSLVIVVLGPVFQINFGRSSYQELCGTTLFFSS